MWYCNTAPETQAKISKSIIHPFSVRGYEGLTINPYQGCQHRCGYCYATYEWSPEFYDKVYAKINSPDILEKELKSWKREYIDPVMISSATDAYQPAELKYGLTRKCIQVLQKYGVPYCVFTKSIIIERDLDLHSSYSDNCCIAWSITTCNEKVRRVIEPGTPPADRIFDVIKKFVDRGVRCVVNINPVVPLVTDSPEEIDTIVEKSQRANVQYAFAAVMRLRQDIWERIKTVLEILGVPDGVELYSQIFGFVEPISANYVPADRKYSKQVLEMIEQKMSNAGIAFEFPEMPSRQITRQLGDGVMKQTCLTDY